MTTVRSARRPPVRGSVSSNSSADDLGQLVAALAAPDVDDDVRVAPLRDLLQQHGLAGAEAAGHGRGAAARDGEQQVEHPLAGVQRFRGLDAAPARARRADRPCGGHRDRGAADRGHRRVGRVLPGRGDRADHPAHARRREHAVLQRSGAGDHAEHRPGPDLLADGDRGAEGPPAVPVHLPVLVADGQPGGRAGQRPEHAVEHAAEQARPQARGQRVAPRGRRVAGREAAGVLVGLHGDVAVPDRHDLAGQPVRPQRHDVEHGHVAEVRHLDQRPGDPVIVPPARPVTAATTPRSCRRAPRRHARRTRRASSPGGAPPRGRRCRRPVPR